MSSSDILTNSECSEIIKTYLKTDDYKNFTAEIKPLEGAPAGFMSDHYKIRFQVELSDETVQELVLFAKTIPRKVPLHTDYVQNSGAYFKETTFYSQVIPGLRRYLLETKNNDNSGSFRTNRWAPSCFFTRPDILVFQDLSVFNFKVCNNRKMLDLKHCDLVLKEIANFHAASLVLEEKRAEITGTYCNIKEIFPIVFDESIISSISNDDSKGWFHAGVRSILPLVDLLPKFKDKPELRNVIRHKIADALNRLGYLVGTSKTYRNVVCHGDLWANNILVRYNTQGDPEEVRFVDYQLVRYTPPAHDVMCFLHLTTDRAFRAVHYEQLLATYYNALSSELLRNGLSPEHLLPEKEFRDSCEYLRELGVITAVLYYQMILMKGEITAPIFACPEEFNRFMLTDRSAEVCKSFLMDEVYRERLNEAMEELIESYIRA